jgi:hypothetical protein
LVLAGFFYAQKARSLLQWQSDIVAKQEEFELVCGCRRGACHDPTQVASQIEAPFDKLRVARDKLSDAIDRQRAGGPALVAAKELYDDAKSLRDFGQLLQDQLAEALNAADDDFERKFAERQKRIAVGH